ncbi:MAG: flagellar brake protein [Thermovenabulum sp.]|uniref:flagellar brake protein n=1 Tax=Thermovenabulum sp. TaxID=3100335 RepID=UPI003C7A8C54
MKYRFAVGMKVELEVERENEKYNFLTKIEEIKDKTILLGMPMYRGNYFFLNVDEEVFIFYCVNDLYYGVKGKVIAKSYLPFPVIEVELLEEPKRIQRRSFFRIPVTIKIKIKKLDSNNWNIAYIKNISGGGALINTHLGFDKGEILEMQIPIENEIYEIKAKVVRVIKDNMRLIYPFEVAVEYCDIPERIRDKIIKFIMEEQRKLRKKGYY